MDFDEYQEFAAATDFRTDLRDLAIPILGLAGEIGSLVADYKKHIRSEIPQREFAEEAQEDLGDLLWYIAAVARGLDLKLGEIADDNLRKVTAVWGSNLPAPADYDSDFPSHQRLPRRFKVQFRSEIRDGLHHVAMHVGKKPIGDPLNDNSYVDDKYRFHDAFHLACAAVLGWSPILRHLLKCKRKNDARVDRVEDGARARAIEEGISAFVFAVAGKSDYFQHAERIDWELLKALKRMTQHLEVSNQPPIAWQQTIFQAYAVWRELIENDGGEVVGDLDQRTLKFVSGEHGKPLGTTNSNATRVRTVNELS